MQTLLALAVAALVAFVQTAANTGAIAGRVVEEVTGTPIPAARVTVLTVGPPPTPGSLRTPTSYDTTSDDQGRFTVADLPSGGYIIRFQKSGFATDSGLGVPPSELVQVAAGQAVQVERTLARGAIITGHVRDAAGEPVADARVFVQRRMPGMGRPLPIAGSGAQSNDLGEFRLFGLPAGEYLVQAAPRSDRSVGPGAGTPGQTILAPTYFPSVADSASAQTVFLSPGQIVDGVDIKLQVVPAFRLTGVVVDETGAPVDGAMVWVMTAPGGGPPTGPPPNARSDSAGRFIVPNLQAGTYEVAAAFPVVTQAAVGGPAPAGPVTGFISSSVGGISGGVAMAAETRGGTTTQFHADTANRVVVEVNADVSGLKVVARRP